ncbi:putative secondary metabolism biosynthetic enzyme [Diaporthe eres]
MQALRAHSRTSGLKLEETEIPKLGPSDVLIRVVSAGISPGTFKMIQAGKTRVPSTVGHEASGTIESMGSDTSGSGLKVGDRVRLHPNLACRACHHCDAGQDSTCERVALIGFSNFGIESELYDQYHNGGLAEFVRAPHYLVDKLPDCVSFEVAAKVHDLATASRALKLVDLRKTSTIILTAPTGAMGALTLRLAAIYSVRHIILVGRSKERLEQVRSLTSVKTSVLALEPSNGFDPETANLVSELKTLAPEGIDAIIDYFPAGNVLNKIVPALRTGGTLVHMGGNSAVLQMPLMVIMVNSWKVTGGRANTRLDVHECLEWLSTKQIDIEDLFTHKFKMSEIDQALDLLVTRKEPTWLSVVNMS